MRRIHLFEFGDLPWFPQLFRDAETAYLAAAYRLLPQLTRQWAEKIAATLIPGEPAHIVDLASGSGGPLPAIIDELQKRGYDVRATLTDFYPSRNPVKQPRIQWLAGRVDATKVPPTLAGIRTMFSAFHHFRPDQVKAILKDAFDQRRPICIFEPGPGGVWGAVLTLAVPFTALGIMPLARPFRWSYLIFTYLIPLIPLMLFWDGVVSNLRIYSPEQLRELTQDLQAPGYAWEIGRIRVAAIPGGVPFICGRAKMAA